MPVTVTGSSGAAVQSSGISQPLNCEIPSAGGDTDHLYHHHHHHLHHPHLDQQQHYYHSHYQSSLLAVVGSTGTPPAQSEDEQQSGQTQHQISDRMTTDLADWDVDAPTKGSMSHMETSQGINSPPTTAAHTATQITASTASSSSSATESPQQDLWWTEGLAMQAQQEYPGELGE